MRTKFTKITIATILTLAMAFAFSCSSDDDDASIEPSCNGQLSNSCPNGGNNFSSSLRSSSSSNIAGSYPYCYGYGTYVDCNLIGGKWIPDAQYCLSGGGSTVNADYCIRNGIIIDDTHNSSSSSSASSSSFIISSSSSSATQSSSSVMSSSSSETLSSSNIPCTAANNTETLYCSNGVMKEYGILTDSRDGKKYKTIEFWANTWMAENLKYEAEGSRCGSLEQQWVHPNNGQIYPDVYYHVGYPTTICQEYGRLYNWATAMQTDFINEPQNHQGICPDGWIIPDQHAWNMLFCYANGQFDANGEIIGSCSYPYENSTAGNYLKAIAKGGEDKLGFSALLGGYGANNNNDFKGVDKVGEWWNSSGTGIYSYNYQYATILNSGTVRAGEESFKGDVFISVRCIKNSNVFPLGFIGTWKREQSAYTSTLTFTSTTLKASNQSSYWNLSNVSSDIYTFGSASVSRISINIILTNDKLVISNDSGSGENNWNGVWIKQ